MIMEEQGIMSLPEGRPQIDPSLFDTEIKNIAKSDPKAFKNDLLTSLEEVDPQVVAEFKAELSQMSLSAEVIDALQVMVDEILASPEKYEKIRAKYLAQEVPEELLPAMFDPTFFGGLELALNELEKGSSASPNLESSPLIASPMPMADGGIATVAQAIASMGRRGDTMLAHITPEEAALLQRMGGSGTINPATGLPEFFLKKIFKSAKSVLKGVGKAVNKLAKSDIGRIALTIAATYYMGPAGFNIGASTFTGATLVGVQAAAGSTLVSLAAGDSLKDSLKSGLTAGVTAGFGDAFTSALPKGITNQYIRSGIGGALAGTGVGLARGQSLKDALKSGAGGAAQGALRNYLLDKTGIGSVQKNIQGFLPEIPEDSFFKLNPTGTTPMDSTGTPKEFDPLGDLVKGTGKKIGAVGDLFSMKKQDPAPIENKGIDTRSVFKEIEDNTINNFVNKYGVSEFRVRGIVNEYKDISEQYDAVRGGYTRGSALLLDPEITNRVSLKEQEALSNFKNNLSGPLAEALKTEVLDQLPAPISKLDKRFVDSNDQRFRIGPAPIDNKSFTPKQAEQAAIRNYRLQNPTLKTLTDSEVLELIRPRSFGENLKEGVGGIFNELTGGPGTSTEGLRRSITDAAGAVIGAPKYLYDKSGQLIEDIRSGYTRDQPFPEDYASFGEKIGRSADVAGEKIAEYLPGDTRRAKLAANIRKRAEDKFNERVKIIENTPGITSEEIAVETGKARSEMIAAKAMEPGMVSMYGPAALGLGALAYAGGAFGEEEEAEAEMFDPYYSGTDYIRDNPQLFSRRFKSYTPYLYAKGGIAQEFPRKTGPINGPGTGTSDSIPAMLSDGEFVMTAKAVRNIGGGSRRKGAAKMYKMMKELEKRTA